MKRKKNEPDKNTKHAATHEIDGGVRGLLTSISVPKGKQHLEEKCFIVVCFFWYVLHFSHSFLRFLAPVDFLLLSLPLRCVHVSLFHVNDIRNSIQMKRQKKATFGRYHTSYLILCVGPAILYKTTHIHCHNHCCSEWCFVAIVQS